MLDTGLGRRLKDIMMTKRKERGIRDHIRQNDHMCGERIISIIGLGRVIRSI